MMSNEQFDTFITALRSGDYAQGTDRLMTPKEWADDEPHAQDEFCCLGLYCQINGVDLRAKFRTKSRYVPDRYYELDGAEHAPQVLRNAMTYNQREDLAKMNDSGATFETIADYLEAHRDEFVRKEAA